MADKASLTGAHLRTPRAAAIAGMIFAVLLITSITLLRLSVPTDPLDSGSWLRGSSGRVMFALNLVPFAGIAFRVGADAAGRLVPVPAGDGVGRALSAIVAVALGAQASGAWPRLKACREETCRWVFFDGSRNCSSSWCSMSICGNRSKSAAYRRRRRRVP